MGGRCGAVVVATSVSGYSRPMILHFSILGGANYDTKALFPKR